MSAIRNLGICLVVLVFVAGCESMPTVTRSGDVKDIIIGDDLSPKEIAVNAGDEVRWINKRTAPVRIVFLDPAALKQLSCKNNVGGWMTPSDTAKLGKSETTSVCFRDPGYVRYTVRMESGDMTGEHNVSGVVRVGGQSTGQTSDPNTTARSREETGNQSNGRPTEQKSEPPKSEPSSSTSTITTTTTTTTPAK